MLEAEGCKYSDFFVSEIISVDGNMTSCKDLCNTDLRCWATVEYVPDSCVMLSLQGYGVQNFTMSSKYCFNSAYIIHLYMTHLLSI